MKARVIAMGGFLGAGKTTSICRLASWLATRWHRVAIITDSQPTGLLAGSSGRRAALAEEIPGGCFCCRTEALMETILKLDPPSRPNIFIAEAERYCADLIPTIVQPLRTIYKTKISFAPFSVVVDPINMLHTLGLESRRGFAPEFEDILRKQMEEAEIITINKCDVFPSKDHERLKTAVATQFPGAMIHSVSARMGQGCQKWFDSLLNGNAERQPFLRKATSKTFVVITPFSRPKNLKALMEMWAKARCGMEKRVRWVPICHDPSTRMPVKGWIRSPGAHVPDPAWDPCYWKCNEGLRQLFDIGLMNREHYFGFLCDDGTYDAGFFATLDHYVADEAAEVIVVGARRYNGSPSKTGDVLAATPENMRPCRVGLEQFFVRGDIMRDFQFENHEWGDGKLVEKLFARNPAGFRYVTDTFVNFNILPK